MVIIFIYLLLATDTTVSDITAGTTSSTLAASPMTSEAVTVSTTTVTYGRHFILLIPGYFTIGWYHRDIDNMSKDKIF